MPAALRLTPPAAPHIEAKEELAANMRTSAAVAKMASLLVMFLPRLVAVSNTEERTGFLRVGQTVDVSGRDSYHFGGAGILAIIKVLC